MKRNLLHMSMAALILAFAVGMVQNPFTSTYIEKMKDQTATVSKMQENSLYEELQQKAPSYHKAPIDAKIDRVWKAIPGYNGMELDIDASYKKLKGSKTIDKKKLVFKQIPPKVKLQDLPPSPIYKGNPEKPMVTLLVNVAWGNEYLPKLLKIMKNAHVHTTFFLDGSWVKKNPSLAKMILDEGHEIGNHAYTHPDMKQLTNKRIREELSSTNQVIQATLGDRKKVPVKWFAPPSGSYRDDVVKIAAEEKMRTIMWSVDTVDWRKPNPAVMAQSVIRKLHPGAMILMHPTSSTADGLQQIIDGIKAKGYAIGTVSDLMDEKRLHLKSSAE
ncbi:polysaccharide deacetylase family protein [Fictibacillus enclensis]|uniref:polysaccharide deacetylase family protein n=1 Tax=Fictibacillus enclensis TaxID=1017270 RepID=UPI0024BFD7D5|nr:polysaccharide deacetylase family protein [Fictibacillus enclensis]MDM5198914.1 polysaccharide deacetylase family protein [Fictibacillus enclensis]MDM5338116.1 polysaccharide deacetylase family protein [Fictibacillus enclensis]WHY74462.1 polysaccharide deacetylase family protein [Fictibacillus enclensis]